MISAALQALHDARLAADIASSAGNDRLEQLAICNLRLDRGLFRRPIRLSAVVGISLSWPILMQRKLVGT